MLYHFLGLLAPLSRRLSRFQLNFLSGNVLVEHPGMWMAPIRAGSITDLQVGHVFWGKQKLPAVRFQFVNKITKRPERAVIASAEPDPLSALRSLSLA